MPTYYTEILVSPGQNEACVPDPRLSRFLEADITTYPDAYTAGSEHDSERDPDCVIQK